MGAGKLFLNSAEEERLVKRVSLLEKHTSAEVRIHIAKKTSANGILADAVKTFQKIGMAETKDKNGVMIYIAVESHEVTCIGDKNAHAKIGDDGWKQVVEVMTSNFKKGDYYLGVHNALDLLEDWLKEHFPPSAENPDELPNTLSKD